MQANLGHATAAFTLDVYSHVTEKMKQDSATRMQRFYESIREKIRENTKQRKIGWANIELLCGKSNQKQYKKEDHRTKSVR